MDFGSFFFIVYYVDIEYTVNTYILSEKPDRDVITLNLVLE